MRIPEEYSIYILATSVFLVVLFYLFILGYIVTEITRGRSNKKFSESFDNIITSDISIDMKVWAISQMEKRWYQTNSSSLTEFRKFLDKKIKDSITDSDISSIKSTIDEYERQATISAIPPFLQPYVSDLMKNQTDGGMKAEYLASHIRNSEAIYGKKISTERIKNNVSLAVGIVGTLIGLYPFLKSYLF